MRRWLAVAFTLGVGGCSCPGTGSNDSGFSLDGSVPVSRVRDVFLTDVCTALIQCYGWEYCSIADCVRDQTVLGLSAFEAELDAGWLRYDPVAAYACHDRFAGDPCGFGFVSFFVPTVTEVLAACGGGTVTGQRQPGQTCASSADCVPGASCQSDTRTCPGTCLSFLPKGAACTVGSGPICDWRQGINCNAGRCRGGGLTGDPCTDPNDCKNLNCKADAGQCVAQATLGQRCTRIGNSQEPDCAAGLWCDARFDVGTCLAAGAAGAACFDDQSCQLGLVCAPSGDAGFAVGRCSSPLASGTPCGTNSSKDCAMGLFCASTDAGRQCSPLPGQGQRCDAFSSGCAAGLFCAAADGGLRLCLAPRCLDEACGDGTGACAEGRCLDRRCAPNEPPVDNTCAP